MTNDAIDTLTALCKDERYLLDILTDEIGTWYAYVSILDDQGIAVEHMEKAEADSFDGLVIKLGQLSAVRKKEIV